MKTNFAEPLEYGEGKGIDTQMAAAGGYWEKMNKIENRYFSLVP